MFVLVTVLVGFHCSFHCGFPSAGALLIENNLNDDRSPSVTVTISEYCFEAIYIFTVRFGKRKGSDSCTFGRWKMPA